MPFLSIGMRTSPSLSRQDSSFTSNRYLCFLDVLKKRGGCIKSSRRAVPIVTQRRPTNSATAVWRSSCTERLRNVTTEWCVLVLKMRKQPAEVNKWVGSHLQQMSLKRGTRTDSVYATVNSRDRWQIRPRSCTTRAKMHMGYTVRRVPRSRRLGPRRQRSKAQWTGDCLRRRRRQRPLTWSQVESTRNASSRHGQETGQAQSRSGFCPARLSVRKV